MENWVKKFRYLGMWRRMIALLLVCCMTFTLIPVTVLAAETTTWDIGAVGNEGNVTATLSADKTTLTIAGTGAMLDWAKDPEIPWNLDAKSITTVTIGEGVTNIGEGAFAACENLKNIKLPETLISIGDYAFWTCFALPTIIIPEGVTSIGWFAFGSCTSLTSVTMNFGDGTVKDIEGEVFVGIPSSATIYMEAGDVASKTFRTWSSEAYSGDQAATFTDATAASTTLTNVPSYCTITAEYETGTETTTWDIGAVGNEGNVTATLSADKTTLTIAGTGAMKDWAKDPEEIPWNLDAKSITTVTIGEGVTNIGEGVFSACENLKNIKLPETLISIGAYAFWTCSALPTIIIPEGVTSIGWFAFGSCTSLTSVTMNFGDGTVKDIEGEVFVGIPSSATIYMEAGDVASKTFRTWSSEAYSGGQAATFAAATAASTTLTNVPSDCSITAEYETDPIKEKSVTEEMIQVIDDQPYTGSVIEPVLTVQDGEKVLTSGTDYTVKYDKNKNVGTATVTIMGIGNYIGTASKTFKIKKAEGSTVKGYAVPGILKAITNITPKLSDIALDGKGEGTWSWVADQELTADTTNKEQTVQARFTPTDSANYEVVETEVKVAVSKISLAKNQMYRLTKGDVETVEQLVTIVGAALKEGTDYQVKLSVEKDNMVSVKDNEITANNVGVVPVMMDIMIGKEKVLSEPFIVEVKSEQGEQSNNTAEEITALLAEVSKEGNPPKEMVNAIADAMIQMNDKEKQKLSTETLKTLDQLFQKANPDLVVKEPIIEQIGNAENQITKASISGLALAAGLTSGQIKSGDTVQLKIEQEPPSKPADNKKSQMQLKLTLLVNGKKTQLTSPVVVDIQLAQSMDTQGLEIMHQHDDGKVDILTEGKELTLKTFVINKSTKVLTMKVASFSTFTFTTNKDKQVNPIPTKPGDSTNKTDKVTVVKQSAASTGDNTPIGVMMAMVLLGFVGMVGVVWKKKRIDKASQGF